MVAFISALPDDAKFALIIAFGVCWYLYLLRLVGIRVKR